MIDHRKDSDNLRRIWTETPRRKKMAKLIALLGVGILCSSWVYYNFFK